MEEGRNLPCMALYCIGVMCSKPGGGTSQYLRTFFFFSWRGERLGKGEGKVGQGNLSLTNTGSARPCQEHLPALHTLPHKLHSLQERELGLGLGRDTGR